jgi:hypothetical protein
MMQGIFTGWLTSNPHNKKSKSFVSQRGHGGKYPAQGISDRGTDGLLCGCILDSLQ